MDELVESVRKVDSIMVGIASASHEQSAGIDQINKAITQMDTVVQMNASLVEEATAAATSMASQAAGVARAVAQFRVGHEASVAPMHAAAGVAALSRPAEGGAATAIATRREPRVEAIGDEEEWKEF
jgi:hypothetical protein